MTSIKALRSLRAESLAAFDYDQAAICDLAIDGAIDCDDYSTLSPEWNRRLRTMTQAEAIAECDRVIESSRQRRPSKQAEI